MIMLSVFGVPVEGFTTARSQLGMLQYNTKKLVTCNIWAKCSTEHIYIVVRWFCIGWVSIYNEKLILLQPIPSKVGVARHQDTFMPSTFSAHQGQTACVIDSAIHKCAKYVYSGLITWEEITDTFVIWGSLTTHWMLQLSDLQVSLKSVGDQLLCSRIFSSSNVFQGGEWELGYNKEV